MRVTEPIRQNYNGYNTFVCGLCGREFESRAISMIPYPICERHEC